MINISIMYPYDENARFDTAYYAETHMPMSIAFVKSHPGYRGVVVASGLTGIPADTAPAYVSIVNYLFDSVESFWEATLPHGETLQADMLKCTDITPVIQISDVLIHE